MLRKESEGKNKTLAKIAGLNKFFENILCKSKRTIKLSIIWVRENLPSFKKNNNKKRLDNS